MGGWATENCRPVFYLKILSYLQIMIGPAIIAHVGLGESCYRYVQGMDDIIFYDTSVHTFYGVDNDYSPMSFPLHNYHRLSQLSVSFDKMNSALLRRIYKLFTYIRNKGDDWQHGLFGEYFMPLYRQPFIAKPGKPPTNKNLYCYKAGRSISRNGFFIYLRFALVQHKWL